MERDDTAPRHGVLEPAPRRLGERAGRELRVEVRDPRPVAEQLLASDVDRAGGHPADCAVPLVQRGSGATERSAGEASPFGALGAAIRQAERQASDVARDWTSGRPFQQPVAGNAFEVRQSARLAACARKASARARPGDTAHPSHPRYPAAMPPIQVSREVARQFLLGRQGLWPGRRWRGLAGTDKAMRAMGNLQLDPLRVVARAQDLALASRVLDYRENDWAILTYERRRFFEWGGWLAVRPIEELPYYRVLMRRSKDDWWASWLQGEHAAAVEEMRRLLPKRGEVANRHFAMGERARVDSYRGRKDSSVALHYLWRVGEAMVTRRTPTFERVYAPAKAVAPAPLPARGERRGRGRLPAQEDGPILGLLEVQPAESIAPARGRPRRNRGLAGREIDEGGCRGRIEGLRGRYVALAPRPRRWKRWRAAGCPGRGSRSRPRPPRR